MGFSFNGLSGAAVTISGSTGVSLPTTTQTVVNQSFTGTGSTATVYTVTSGKTFYLFAVSCDSATGGSVYANDGTTVRLRFGANVISPVPIAAYTSGQAVKISCTNGNVFNIWGMEQ